MLCFYVPASGPSRKRLVSAKSLSKLWKPFLTGARPSRPTVAPLSRTTRRPTQVRRSPTVTDRPEVRRVRHETKRRSLTVREVQHLTPKMIRVSLEGADLD